MSTSAALLSRLRSTGLPQWGRLYRFLHALVLAAVSPSAPSPSVANLAALALFEDEPLENGAEKMVLTLFCPFVLDKTSLLASDGITIINALSSDGGTGPGRWIRTPAPSQSWALQENWYIDPEAVVDVPSDENNGATPMTPLATFAEYVRRTGILPLSGAVNIKIQSDLVFNSPSSSDGLALIRPALTGAPESSAGFLFIEGGLGQEQDSGTILTSTPEVPATNTPRTITTSLGALSGYIGSRIVVDDTGASAWVVDTANAAYGAGGTLVGPWFNGAAPVGGETFRIYRVTKVNWLQVASNAAAFEVDHCNFLLTDTRPSFYCAPGRPLNASSCYYCTGIFTDSNDLSHASTWNYFEHCYVKKMFLGPGSFADMATSAVDTISVSEGALWHARECSALSVEVLGGRARADTLGVWRDGVTIDKGAVVDAAGTSPLFGIQTGSAYGCYVGPASTLIYSVLPVIEGSGGAGTALELRGSAAGPWADVSGAGGDLVGLRLNGVVRP